MGTSKGYIAPTKPEWSNAKRAVSSYLRNRDSESKAVAVQKYAEAMNVSGGAINSSFASAAGNVLGFVRSIGQNGLDNTLSTFGRDDLIGKEPGYVLSELLNQFTNNAATIEDSMAADALSQAFDNLDIVSIDDLGTTDLDALLREMVTEFININFDLRFDEKIGHGRTPAEKASILKEVHSYIADTIHDLLSKQEIKKMDFANMITSNIVQRVLKEALNICTNFYGEAMK
ncbi:hypothetical protein [Desulfosporosinus sp. FKB]|uniref:hypothetical protein n=1 Tax=Desulfosporosinus sp. FKB TaxID=1969835 RepID=UPI000B49B50D|nr:hypothetical protein [Desulfosporosinus sp. FKB]